MDATLLFLMSTILLIVNANTDEEQQAIDSFYDETTESDWIILAGDVIDDFASKWDENEKWDTINEDVETQKGHYITRKCENIFGNALCLCQFEKLEKIHNCHSGGKKETKKQQRLRSRYIRRQNGPNPANSEISAAIQSQLNNMASSVRTHPLFKRLWGQPIDREHDIALSPQNKIFELKEQKIENEIAAAQIENDYNELDDDEIEEIAEEIDELLEEEEEAKEEEEAEEEDILEYDELINDAYEEDDDDIFDNEEIEAEVESVEAYDAEILEVLDEEVETQNELIEKQGALIEELKQSNAMKEELIEALEDDTDMDDDDEYEYVDEDFDEYQSDLEGDDDFYDDDNDDEFYDDDNYEEDNEEYYDDGEDEESLAEEEYDELYDVDGESDENEQFYEEGDTENDLEKKEREAMVADTFWGLEIYSIAFMVLCCCCVGCYLQKTKCCGYFAKKDKTFHYSEYHSQGGFKRVFGNVDDDGDDIEMGVEQNDSDEVRALHS